MQVFFIISKSTYHHLRQVLLYHCNLYFGPAKCITGSFLKAGKMPPAYAPLLVFRFSTHRTGRFRAFPRSPAACVLCPKQSISHADHGLLHLREILVRLVEDLHVLLDDHSLKDFPVPRLKDIQEAHGLPILIRADGIVDGDFLKTFSDRTSLRFICYPPQCVFDALRGLVFPRRSSSVSSSS